MLSQPSSSLDLSEGIERVLQPHLGVYSPRNSQELHISDTSTALSWQTLINEFKKVPSHVLSVLQLLQILSKIKFKSIILLMYFGQHEQMLLDRCVLKIPLR